MTKIFSVLAVFAVVLLVTNIVIGYRGGDYNGVSSRIREHQQRRARNQHDDHGAAASHERLDAELAELFDQLRPIRQWSTLHVLFGILAALVTVLVNSISITYFIGTSRWCREVVDAYGLDPDPIRRGNSIKRRSFPWALMGMVTVLAIIALGAASDPGTLRPGTASWVMPHFVAALGGTALIAWSLLNQRHYIARNHEIIEELLKQVRDIRTERGLDVEPATDEGRAGQGR